MKGLSGIALLAAVLWVAFTLAVRTRNQAVLDVVRRVNRAVANQQAMRTAGQSGGVASGIRHRGRATSTRYETPVWAFRTDDGSAIPLTYGVNTDWVKNVLASGSAVIVDKGEVHSMERPEVVPLESADPYLPRAVLWILCLYSVDRALQVRFAEHEGAPVA